MGNILVDEALDRLNINAEEERQNSQEKRLSMYLDCYSTYVLELLKSQFHRDNYKRLYPMLASYYNLFKKIVNLKSVIYKREAVRTWYKRDGETQDDNYAEVIQNSNINEVSQLFNKLTNANNTSFARIIGNPGKGIIQYESVPSELISIIQNPEDPSEITHLLHRVVITDSSNYLNSLGRLNGTSTSDCRAKYTVKYFYWDKENYLVLDADKKKDGEIEPNPYRDNKGNGIIPYVLFKNFPSIAGSIWNETVNQDLYDGTLQINVIQTYLNNQLKLTGYRQPWITGIEKDEVAKFNEKASDGLQPIFTSNPDAKIGSFLLTHNIGEIKDCLHDIISEISDNHGVSFSSRVNSADKMSAKALSISQEQIDNIREEQLPLFRRSEQELAEKTVIVANKDLQANIDVEGKLSIDFYEEQPQITVEEKIENDKFYLSKNIKSVTDIYMETDPDCENKEEAEKRITENKAINDKYIDTFGLEEVEDDSDSEDTE